MNIYSGSCKKDARSQCENTKSASDLAGHVDLTPSCSVWFREELDTLGSSFHPDFDLIRGIIHLLQT